MALIKLFKKETYTKEILDIKNSLLCLSEDILNELKSTESVRDYIRMAILHKNSHMEKLINTLIDEMNKQDIVAYHCTRILHPEEIQNAGLIFSDERYIDSLKNSMSEVGIDCCRIDKVISVVKHERDRWNIGNENNRKNEVCFFFDMDYYKEYDKFLAVYGGEFMEFGLSSHLDKGGSYNVYKDIIMIGKPYIVEFSIPYKWLNKYKQEDIARYMIEEWIHTDLRKDKPSHKYGSRIVREIPSKNIITMYEVENELNDIYDYIFN